MNSDDKNKLMISLGMAESIAQRIEHFLWDKNSDPIDSEFIQRLYLTLKRAEVEAYDFVPPQYERTM